jgi:4-hydroxybenzoate polyprenyltransferase
MKKYLSLVKFSHTIFALPFACIGFFLGVVKKGPSLRIIMEREMGIQFLLVLVCMVTARSAAMAFNRYLDRQFDALNPRTAIREIPAGIIAPSSALRFTIANCLLFIVTTYLINPLCFYLSPIALFVILFYSYTKRFTALCHVVLGVGLSLAPIGAYLAVTGVFDWLPLFFSFTVICWVSGFDIIYALQDEGFDKANTLHSIPVALGTKNALHVSELLHLIAALLIIYAGWYGDFYWVYWIASVIFVVMLFYQHSLVKPNDLSKVNIAFMTANGIASIVFGVLVIASLFIKYGW